MRRVELIVPLLFLFAVPLKAQDEPDAPTRPLGSPPEVRVEPLPEVPAPAAPPSLEATPTPPTDAQAMARALEAGPPALLPEANPASAAFIGPPLVPPFELLGQKVAAGEHRVLEWKAGQGFAGGDTLVPVHVVHGSRPGPVLCLTAAIHGDEINGVEIVRRTVNRLDADRLSGTVIAVPIVNLFGFTRGSRYLPDRRDLNRYFPGSPQGSVAARLAYGFFQAIVLRCGALVDFHTGSFDRDNLPQVRADLRLPEVLRFVRGFGSLPVLHSAGARGMLRVAATQAGIPAATFEVGAPGVIQIDQVEVALAAIDALMHHLAMIPDRPLDDEPQAIFYESRWVRAHAGGVLVADVSLGQRVEAGQRLGLIVDPLRNREQPILAPVAGRVIGMARNQVMLPGFAAFHIGEASSAEEVSSAAASGRLEEDGEEDGSERRDEDFDLDP